MTILPVDNFIYKTKDRPVSIAAKIFPSLHFYGRFIGAVLKSSIVAQRGEYDDKQWGESCNAVLTYLEDIGVRVQVSGLDNVLDLKEPAVFIGNHMSFLETLILPTMILPRPVTFVVKEGLLRYPVFKHVLGARNPIAVTRKNPRQDLKTVLEEGVKRLEEGVSVIVFPQSTRSHEFDPAQMNSIGVKLAKRANAPVVPLALKTDALQNGTLLKDFGKIDKNRPVRFAFDSPLRVEGKGNGEQDLINSFIDRKLQCWMEENV